MDLIACVVNDDQGGERRADLRADGVDGDGIRVVELPTGIALITVTPHGENTIVVAPEANHALWASDVDSCASVLTADNVGLAQLEVPLAAVQRALELAGERNA